MSAFLKKLFLKWITIATLGLSAYFLGFSWGTVGLDQKEKQQARLELQRQLRQEQDLRAVGLHKTQNFIFLPTSTSQQSANLSQLE